MRYKDYVIEDFIKDEYFQQWVYEANEETDRFWKDFLKEYPHKAIMLYEARDFLLLMKFGRNAPVQDLEKVQQKINEVIDQLETSILERDTQTTKTIPPVTNKQRTFPVLYSIAASIVLAALALVYFMKVSENNLPDSYSAKFNTLPQNTLTFVTLEDGTTVWLNAKSKLSYSTDFSTGATREVNLEGEAFFDVTENKQKPFIVHTSGISIKVLGTAFNVRAYAADELVETTLLHGKVSILSHETSEHLLTLAPNQKAIFARTSKSIEMQEVMNGDDHIAWKDGSLIFDDKPFEYIVETLERWYGVSITMEDANSLNCTFSARFKDKTLIEVLDLFKSTESINYSIRENHVLITGRLCNYE